MYFLGEVFILVTFIVLVAIPTTDKMPSHHYRKAPEKTFVLDFNSLSQQKQLENVDKILSQPHPLNLKWWAQYKLAQLKQKNSPDESCKNFVELANNDFFPLKQIAGLRAYEVCSHNSKHLSYLSEDKFKTLPWLKTTVTDIHLRKAREKKDLYEIMKYSFEKSKRPLRKSRKVQLTRDALYIAKKIGDKDFEQNMQARLIRLAPRLNNKPKRKDRLSIAHDYRQKRLFDAAEKNYKLVIKSRDTNFYEKNSAYHGLRKVAKLQHNTPKIINATANISKFIEKKYRYYKKPHHRLTKRYHDSLLSLARTYWTYNDFKSANKILNKTQKVLKGKYNLSRVLFIRGRIAEEQKKFKAAIWWFNQALKEKPEDLNLLEDNTWFLAWNLRRTNQLSLATEKFQQLIELTSNSFKKKRYQFWLAKTFLSNNQRHLAEPIFAELRSTDAFGYYGLLAARETSTPISDQFSDIRSLASYEQPNDFNLQFIQWLSAVNEIDIMNSYASATARKLRRQKNFKISTWSPLIASLYNSGQYVKSFRLMGLLPRAHRAELIKAHPEYMFPKPYFKSVKSSTERFGLTPAMIYSIMRQESSFNPRARSFADAFGLMQLLPRVARYTSDKYKVDYKKAEDLYRPSTNIPLGTAFLKELFNKHDGQFILAVASYNASEKAIMNWLHTRYTGDTLEFIEDIPYKETRSYVRLVMRNYAIYEALENFPKNTNFPEWTLALAAK